MGHDLGQIWEKECFKFPQKENSEITLIPQ